MSHNCPQLSFQNTEDAYWTMGKPPAVASVAGLNTHNNNNKTDDLIIKQILPRFGKIITRSIHYLNTTLFLHSSDLGSLLLRKQPLSRPRPGHVSRLQQGSPAPACSRLLRHTKTSPSGIGVLEREEESPGVSCFCALIWVLPGEQQLLTGYAQEGFSKLFSGLSSCPHSQSVFVGCQKPPKQMHVDCGEAFFSI